MNVKLYVTRWVLARGILVMTGTLGRRKGTGGAHKEWYSLETGKWDRYRRHWVCLGRDAFLSLPEAKAAARRAFEEAAHGAVERAHQLREHVKSLPQLRVHDVTNGTKSISELHAFNDDA